LPLRVEANPTKLITWSGDADLRNTLHAATPSAKGVISDDFELGRFRRPIMLRPAIQRPGHYFSQWRAVRVSECADVIDSVEDRERRLCTQAAILLMIFASRRNIIERSIHPRMRPQLQLNSSP